MNNVDEISQNQSPKKSVIEKRYPTKLIEKRLQDGIHQNPSKIITNLTNIDLSNEKITVLELGLKYGVLIQPKEPGMIAAVENVSEQIQNHGI